MVTFSVFAWLVILLSITSFGFYCNAVANIPLRSAEFHDMCDYYYTFNDRFAVQEPSPWLQEKRFDIERARSMVPLQDVEPKPGYLQRYTLRPANSTTVFSDWNTDHVALGDICNWLIKLSQFYMHRNSESKRVRIHKVMVDFVHRYADAMVGKFQQVFPWGGNWYQFSITSTLMLFYFMLITKNDQERLFAADLVLKIISDPKKSLGMKRDQANSVYMALPWIASHYYKGDVYKAAAHPSYEYARRYIKFQVVEHRKDEGLYLDSTYITHTNVLAYGYLSEMTSMSLPLIGLDNLMRNFLLDWRRCQRILAHRTIKYGAIGFHSRDTRLTQFVVQDSAYGIEVIPTCLFMRMYGEDYAFSMSGQVPWIAYYEADKTHDDMAQYWVQCRRVFFAGQEYTATFPDVGFFHQTYVNEDVADDANLVRVVKRCRIPTRTSTTTSFLGGTKHNSQPLNAGFVFAYGTVGILRHFYYCPQMVYDESLQLLPEKQPVAGRCYVDEFILCDYAKHTIDIWIKILLPKAVAFTLHGVKEQEMKRASGIFHLHWDCRSRTLTQDYQDVASTSDHLQQKYPKGIEVVNTNNTVMLLENGKAKMAMYPDSWLDLRANFITRYKDRDYEFAFDSLTNQYWLAGQCIEKI